MSNQVEQLIEVGKKITLSAIESDLNSDNWDALYYASETQIRKLIESGKIDEDFFTRHQNYQEEMRVLMNEFI